MLQNITHQIPLKDLNEISVKKKKFQAIRKKYCFQQCSGARIIRTKMCELSIHQSQWSQWGSTQLYE